MEKRIGAAVILIENSESIHRLNQLLTEYGEIIIARQGLPLFEKGIRVISLIINGSSDQIGALAGKLGRLTGVKIKTILTSFKEESHEEHQPISKF